MNLQQSASYEPDFFSSLYDIENRHFWFRSRNQVIKQVIQGVLKEFDSSGWILELGCGTGNVLRVLEQSCPNSRVVGMDLFLEGLLIAQKRTQCSLVQGDLRRPPFRAHFDIIGLFDVIEHIADDVQVFRDLNYLLKPGGKLLLTVPAHPKLWSYFDDGSRHVRRYTEPELRHKLEMAGYRVEFLTPYMFALYYPLYLWRTLQTIKNKISPNREENVHLHTKSDLRIMPIMNTIMGWLTSWESTFIRKYKKLPNGTSYLAIACHQ